MPDLPTKLCASCGRRITWRKKWERNWEHVKYCSSACRSASGSERDARIEAAMLKMLADRGAGRSICPSEVARLIEPEAWRDLMEPCRCAARRLVARGLAEITQDSRVVDPSCARGPIRVRLRTL